MKDKRAELPRADDKEIIHPFGSACKKGCAHSCFNKVIYIFSSDQARRLREYAEQVNLIDEFYRQYKLIAKCESLEDVKRLDIACPFLNLDTNSEDFQACTIHDIVDDREPPRRIKPDACVVWSSPDIEYCLDPTTFPETIALHNNSLLPDEFDIVKDIRAAVLELPDNEKLTYGPFVTGRRIKLKERKSNTTRK